MSRPLSPSHSEGSSKRQKVEGEGAELPFHSSLFTPSNLSKLQQSHQHSHPYKHAVIQQLFEPSFLNAARQEIVSQLSFTEKETDIYKINQTGDLTNLSGLPQSELSLLPALLKLRDSLYSQEFRKFLQKVTGCGPLSGIKTDMSCAEYNQGCYLLNHDDVIGTRRISFILYLPLEEPAWKPEWGGALELYPVEPKDEKNPDRPNVPTSKPTVIIPPSFNQFVFFEVQPGHSFHSVEEVAVEGSGEKGGVGARVSLSGWFHKPIEGEEGYEGSEGFEQKSSLQQLYATTLSAPTPYPEPLSLPLPLVPSQSDLTYLSKYLNPAYTTPKILSHLRSQFIENSFLVLSDFLNSTISNELERLVRERDSELERGRRGKMVNGQRCNLIPKHSTGEDQEDQGWKIKGPPHLQRYLSLNSSTTTTLEDTKLQTRSTTKQQELSTLLLRLKHELFESLQFASFLSSLSNLLPIAHTIDVRRFRPGLDYTLARGEPASTTSTSEGEGEGGGQAKLDVGLNLTPRQEKEEDREEWEGGECGGWDIWLVGEEGGDEATYGGSKSTKPEAGGEENGEKKDDQQQEEAEVEEEEEEDSTLLSLEPTFNRLHLVLRDPGVLSFVKYVSTKAPGSRWDINGEWEVRGIEEEEDEGEEEVKREE